MPREIRRNYKLYWPHLARQGWRRVSRFLLRSYNFQRINSVFNDLIAQSPHQANLLWRMKLCTRNIPSRPVVTVSYLQSAVVSAIYRMTVRNSVLTLAATPVSQSFIIIEYRLKTPQVCDTMIGGCWNNLDSILIGHLPWPRAVVPSSDLTNSRNLFSIY